MSYLSWGGLSPELASGRRHGRPAEQTPARRAERAGRERERHVISGRYGWPDVGNNGQPGAGRSVRYQSADVIPDAPGGISPRKAWGARTPCSPDPMAV